MKKRCWEIQDWSGRGLSSKQRTVTLEQSTTSQRCQRRLGRLRQEVIQYDDDGGQNSKGNGPNYAHTFIFRFSALMTTSSDRRLPVTTTPTMMMGGNDDLAVVQYDDNDGQMTAFVTRLVETRWRRDKICGFDWLYCHNTAFFRLLSLNFPFYIHPCITKCCSK